jgi:hypothetical protein
MIGSGAYFADRARTSAPAKGKAAKKT